MSAFPLVLSLRPVLCRALRACQACLPGRSRAGGLTEGGGGPRDRQPCLQGFRRTWSPLSSTGRRGPCWPTRTQHAGGASCGSADPAAELCRGQQSRWRPAKPCAPRKAKWGAWGTVANEARTGCPAWASCRLGTARSQGHGGRGPRSTATPCGSKRSGSCSPASLPGVEAGLPGSWNIQEGEAWRGRCCTPC